MSFLSNVSVERKILLGFGLSSFLCLVISGVALLSLSRVNSSTVDIDSNWMPSIRILANIRYETATMHRAMLNSAICDTVECRQRYSGIYQKAKDQYLTSRQAYARLISSAEEKQISDELDQEISGYLPIAEQAMAIAASGNKDEAGVFIQSKTKLPFEAIGNTLERDIALNNSGADLATKAAAATYNSARLTILITFIVALFTSIFAGRFLARLIARPLVKAADLLERVANKDLTQTIEVQSQDEVGKMATSLNSMVLALRQMMQQIRSDAETLNHATVQIAAAANQTSDAARQQSGHVQQVAAASQEMASVISEISHNTEKAAIASQESARNAQEGGSVVHEAVNSMEHISQSNSEIVAKMERLGNSSIQIGKVVSVIQEIADQTNLLALNAAIESARAGEHGRGFAVVAGEVRRLAERTRNSTEEISSIISAIQTETKDAMAVTEGGREMVLQGLERAREAGTALKSIIATAHSSEEMVALVATAATEQTSASQEVSQSMERIAQMVEEASSAADQTAQTCKDLAQLAASLEQAVSQFKLNEGSGINKRPVLAFAN